RTAVPGMEPSAGTPRTPAADRRAASPRVTPIEPAASPPHRAPATPMCQVRAEAVAAPLAESVRPAVPLPGAVLAEGADARARRIATLDWDALEAEIHACRQCVLGNGRTQAVPGVGDRAGRWMLVGEGPGKEEDRKGEPFVGQAGRLLDNMLGAIG